MLSQKTVRLILLAIQLVLSYGYSYIENNSRLTFIPPISPPPHPPILFFPLHSIVKAIAMSS
ncbi:MAG: hypothetical protein LRZ84_15490 [Desertifilum sp.]|nr:hypothetical protein [Desertifilum sp.]